MSSRSDGVHEHFRISGRSVDMIFDLDMVLGLVLEIQPIDQRLEVADELITLSMLKRVMYIA